MSLANVAVHLQDDADRQLPLWHVALAAYGGTVEFEWSERVGAPRFVMLVDNRYIQIVRGLNHGPKLMYGSKVRSFTYVHATTGALCYIAPHELLLQLLGPPPLP